MKMDEKISVRVPCPVCDAWLDVDVAVTRGLIIDDSTVSVSRATLLVSVDQESLDVLSDEHECFKVTPDDQAALDAAVDAAFESEPVAAVDASAREPRF